MSPLSTTICAVLVSGCTLWHQAAPERALEVNAEPWCGGPWCGLGGSGIGNGISGPFNCTPQGLVTDSRSRPHIIWDVWKSNGKQTTQVCYAYWDGRQWAGLDGSMRGGGVSHSKHSSSSRARLAVDSKGWPHIVWINIEDYRSIEYRRWDGASWRADSIPWIKNETAELALAVDSEDMPHIASIERAEERDSPWAQVVRYRYWDGRKWRERPGSGGTYIHKTSEGGSLGGICLKLDSKDRPHLAWSGGQTIFYAYWDSSGWRHLDESSRSRGLDRTDTRSFTPTLALDRRDRPHIAWREEVNRKALQTYYRYWDGRRWAELGNSATDAGVSLPGHNSFIPQLAVDSRCRPHLLWCCGADTNSKSEVYYKYWDGRAWRTSAGSGRGGVITDTQEGSNWVQLAVDMFDRAHVAWASRTPKGPPELYYIFLPRCEDGARVPDG
ncbi:MAG: hypothetical protein ACYTF6_11625 [Planctomycetota bacterium]|jgi:hypothetical protein